MRLRRLALLLACFLAAPLALVWADDEADERLLREHKLPTDGKGLLELLRQRTPDAASEKRLHRLIRDLGDDDFETRERATADLRKFGVPARGALRAALKDPDLEIRRRAEEILKGIEKGAADVI